MYVCIREMVMIHTYIVGQSLRAARAVFSFATWCVCAAAFLSVYFAFRFHRAWVRSGRPVFGWRWRVVRFPHHLRARLALRRSVRAWQRRLGIRPSFPWVRAALGFAVAVVIGAFAWQWLVLLGAVVASIGIQFVGHWFLFGGCQQYRQSQQRLWQRRASRRR